MIIPKIGDSIYLISAEYSCNYPELVPTKRNNDLLVDGRDSIHYFIQTETIPQDNRLYKAVIEDIIFQDRFEFGRIVVYIIIKDLEVVRTTCKKRFYIYNDFHREMRNQRKELSRNKREEKFRRWPKLPSEKIDGLIQIAGARIYND